MIPSRREEYLDAAEAYFQAIIDRGSELGGVRLQGSWETIVGRVGEFTHILEYAGYRGFDETLRATRRDKVGGFDLLREASKLEQSAESKDNRTCNPCPRQ